MSMKDEVLELKHELEEVRRESFAFEVLRAYQKSNRRMFIALIIVSSMLLVTIGGLMCVLI